MDSSSEFFFFFVLILLVVVFLLLFFWLLREEGVQKETDARHRERVTDYPKDVFEHRMSGNAFARFLRDLVEIDALGKLGQEGFVQEGRYQGPDREREMQRMEVRGRFSFARSFFFFHLIMRRGRSNLMIDFSLSDAILDLPDQIARGDFAPLFDWLGRNVHNKGSLLSTAELVMEATGTPLGTAAFREHLQQRYLN